MSNDAILKLHTRIRGVIETGEITYRVAYGAVELLYSDFLTIFLLDRTQRPDLTAYFIELVKQELCEAIGRIQVRALEFAARCQPTSDAIN